MRAFATAALCALGLLLPASQALADDAVEPAVGIAEVAVPETSQEATQPAAPTAGSSQSSEDTSGADQYTEQGIPGGEAPTEPTTSAPEPDPAPTPQPTATAAQDDTAVPVASAEDTLPRTGLDTVLIAVLGVGMLGTGVLVRRMSAAQSPSR
jgi:LPXTG-motif cell wall-anchored protein